MSRNSRKKPLFVFNAAAVFVLAVGVLVTAGRLCAAPADQGNPPASAEAGKRVVKTRPLTEEERILHALNRLGFGARPGDVEKVKAMGLSSYIDQQLHPERIDDAVVEKRLSAYAQLQLSNDQITAIYQEFTGATKQMQNQRKQLKKSAAAPEGAAPAAVGGGNDPAAAPVAANKAKKNALAMADPQMRQNARAARLEMARVALPVAQAHEQFVAAKALRAIESERQLQEVLVDFWSNHFNIDMRKPPCGILKILDDRDTIRPHVFGKFRDLLGASAKSPAMLVYLDNFQSMSDTVQTLRKRPGKVRQTQAAPAAPGQTVLAGVPALPKKAGKGPTGLNENYAREIMELHTLGVDGGYTQQDVREVARCLTGWSIGRANGGLRPARGKYADAGSFRFYPALHDNGEKVVLGHVIPAGGDEQDGEKVLDILASHPATMRHISTQLCQRLVSDTPPDSLVEKCVATWKRTDGDLREIVRTIALSPEFFSRAAYQSKIKSPFEYAVSSVRALGGTYENAAAVEGRSQLREATYLIKPPKGGGYLDLNTTSIVGQVGTMGQPLFQYQAPTGYPEDSRKWVSSGALISRLNFSLALTGGKLTDVRLPDLNTAAAQSGDPKQLIDRLAGQILHGSITPSTRTTLLNQIGPPSSAGSSESKDNLTANRLAALLLGSPEFQRH